VTSGDSLEPTGEEALDAAGDLRPSRGVAMSNWMVRRASSFLAARSSRRGFLVGAAVTGSALAASGVKFATQPGSAYAAITDCPPTSLCNDGYTEFCCTINQGQNTCPPGSFAGGWWRADFSSFCNGTRYYIDCMQDCCGPRRGDGFCSGCIACQCGAGCDTRKVYCNYFRYGQCHQEIAESGPIACRVVTCTPPYATDPSCSPVSAVDNSTAEHTAACLTPRLPPAEFFRRKGRTVLQVMLYNTLNVFYVSDDGTLIQKAFAPGLGGADANGWVTSRLTAVGRCKAGGDVDAQDGYQNNFHLFARAADGDHMVHLTWVRAQGRWVEQTH